MNQDQLNALPEYKYRGGTAVKQEDLDSLTKEEEYKPEDTVGLNGESGCCICMEDWIEGDSLRVLKCNHTFHRDCCDQWLLINNTCPICRDVVAQAQNGENVDEESNLV